MRGTANLLSLPLRGGLELLNTLGAGRQPQAVITKVTNESLLLTFFFTRGGFTIEFSEIGVQTKYLAHFVK